MVQNLIWNNKVEAGFYEPGFHELRYLWTFRRVPLNVYLSYSLRILWTSLFMNFFAGPLRVHKTRLLLYCVCILPCQVSERYTSEEESKLSDDSCSGPFPCKGKSWKWYKHCAFADRLRDLRGYLWKIIKYQSSFP